MENPKDREEAILAEVGRITLSWNSLEETLEALIWHYLGGPEKGHIVTTLLGNASRQDALDALVAQAEAIPKIAEHLKCFSQAFETLRINRNTIVHSISFAITHDGEEFFFERRKKSIQTREYDTQRRPVAALQALAAQITGLREYGNTILAIMKRRAGLIEQPFYDWDKPPAWPERFPIPEKLSQPPPQTHGKRKNQPPPSGE